MHSHEQGSLSDPALERNIPQGNKHEEECMSRRIITRVVIHCSATPPDRDIGAADIRRWHVEENGWRDIGYHYVIRRSGKLETGRPLGEPGAHARGFNKRSVGICLVGDGGDFTPAQWRALEVLVAWLQREWPGAEVLGHRDLPGVDKACPTFDVRPWWAARRARAAVDDQPPGAAA